MIENQRQLKVTQQKVTAIDERIAAIRQEPPTPARDLSLQSLLRTRKQMLEEVLRFWAAAGQDVSAAP
jgi:hypothetical protein